MRDIVEAAWDNRELLDNAKTQETIRNVISLLDKGELRVAEKINGNWVTHQHLKKHWMKLIFSLNKTIFLYSKQKKEQREPHGLEHYI